ncbi:MAG: hypothetical protein EOO38_08485 [Cytophagaceae bacterium]|nr:MAG: hypothetical protein EOO38_08485 [Cytophagaceae bacterium]
MLRIPYHASNFSPRYGPALAGASDLLVTWPELVWAAVTVGKPGLAYLFSHGMHSVSDMIVRSHTVYADLRQTYSYFEKSALYDGLDPTEKGATSYFLGMMATKIICARLLDTPFVFHLSMLKTLGGSAVLHTKSQPDLIGRDRAGNWIVAEAKGRTNNFSISAMSKAKLQTRQLRRINGAFPSLRIAVQAYFSPELNFAVSDPDEYDEGAEDVDFDVRGAIRDYYSYVLGPSQTARIPQSVLGQDYLFRTVEEVGVSIGVAIATLKLLEERDALNSTEPYDLSQAPGGDDGQGTVVFPDGLAISLDQRWSEEIMRRDPRTRRTG